MKDLLILKNEAGFPVSIETDAILLKQTALQGLLDVVSVGDSASLAAAAMALSTAAGLVKKMDKSREEVKAPILDAGRRIDAMAKGYCEPLTQQITRVKKVVADYQTQEASRIAEENRKAEEELQRQTAEADRLRREEYDRLEKERHQREEALRIEHQIAEENRLKEADRLYKERLASEAIAAESKNDGLDALREDAAEEARQELERLNLSQEAERLEEERKLVLAREEEKRFLAQQEADRLADQSRMLSVKPIEPAKVSGISTRKVWAFEVLDVHAVYSHDKSFCSEPQVIHRKVQDAIKNGVRQIPGLRIYEETAVAVR